MGNYKFYPLQVELVWQNFLKEVISTHIPTWKPHFDSLQDTTGWFSQSGRGKKIVNTRVSLQHQHFRYRIAYTGNIQQSSSFVFEVYIHRAGNVTPQHLINIFLNTVSTDPCITSKILWSRKRIYKLHILWSLYSFHSSPFRKE